MHSESSKLSYLADDAWAVLKKHLRKESKALVARELEQVFAKYGADLSDSDLADAARAKS